MLTKKQKVSKRIFDILLSLILLPVVVVPFLIFLTLAALSTGRNGLFSQIRIGRNAQPFRLYKIRTLKGEQHQNIVEILDNETAIGKFLRRTKMDEIPQIYNILNGDMSWVGPRPDVPGYADMLEGEDRIILSLRPGLTGPATIKYKNEDELLLAQKDPKYYNDTVIWPDKVAMNKIYTKDWSLLKDIKYIWASIFK